MINNNTLNLLRDLVAFKSVTPDHAGSLDYIAQIVTQLGGRNIRLDRNQTANLIAELGDGDKIFAFAGHVDVVPSGEYNMWINSNPFELYQDGDNLVGRGVADMKGSIAAFLSALIEFVNKQNSSKYKIMLLLTADEEGAAIDGTPVMVKYLKNQDIRIANCVIGEPSCSAQLGDVIKVGRRGSLTGNLTVYGKQGHIAYPHLCLNPIHLFAKALVDLSGKEWDNGTEYFPATSLQFANLNSGLGVTNVIPGSLTTNFNFRYNTHYTNVQLQTLVGEILDSYGFDYAITWNHSASPFMAPLGDLVNNLSQAIFEVCQIIPQNKTDGGTSDGRFLIECCDEMVEFGLRNNNIHQINESTTLTEINNLTQIYYQLLQLVFKN